MRAILEPLPHPTIMTRSTSRRLALAATLALALSTSATVASAQLRAARVVAAEGARKALVAAEAEAKTNQWNVSIAVVDAAGELVAFLRMDAASPSTIDVAQAKARTAARFRRPTKALDSSLAGGRLAILGMPGATPIEGAVPIVVGGEVVGAVGVSGATSAQDAQVAAAGARAVVP